MSRPFNSKAYEAFDLKNKNELVKIMNKKGYSLIGDINKEHYKKYDVKFKKDNFEISFENETRPNFISIRDIYKTIHIPIRKKETQADFYVVWKPELDEFFLIERKIIEKHKSEVITLSCKEFEEEIEYVDSFLDIPKSEAMLYRKINDIWKIIK